MVALLEEQPTRTVTVSIGRNVGKDPMPPIDWRRFQRLVRRALRYGELVFEGTGEGIYADSVEMSATFVAALPVSRLDLLRWELGQLRGAFEQDAIALTVGEVEFI